MIIDGYPEYLASRVADKLWQIEFKSQLPKNQELASEQRDGIERTLLKPPNSEGYQIDPGVRKEQQP